MYILLLAFLLFPLIAASQTNFNKEENLKQAGKYEYVYAFENNYAVFRTFNKKMGVIDSAGNVVIEPVFSFIHNIKELKNLFEVGNNVNGKFKRGFIDLKGKTRIPIIFDNVYYTEGLIRITLEKKMGVIDTLNRTILPLQFDNVSIYNDVIVAGVNGINGLYNFEGKRINNLQFIWYINFVNNKAIITFQDKSNAIIDHLGKIILEPIKDHNFIEIFNDDLYLTKNNLNGKVGVVNSKRKFVISCKYDEIKQVKELFIAKRNNKKGIISLTDSILKPFVYDEIFPSYFFDTVVFDEYKIGDNYIAKKEKFYGVINPTVKNDIIPFHYKNVELLFGKYYVVQKKENENGLYSESGEQILNEEYIFYNAFKNSIFATHYKKPVIINLENGKASEIKVLVDEFVKSGNESQFPISENQIFILKGEFGVVNYKNQIVIPAEYELIENIYLSKEFIVKNNGKYGVVNSENKIIVEIEYDQFERSKEYILFTKANEKLKKIHGVTYR